ncbi:N-acetylmuramoyl-L-alanine amidase [Lactobacillus equicursoris]|uniref:N-acetylmuramoyl-L-alanine amidase n=1 Tax=Lactobacillus equicursoris TaxID=420645 RepID=A0A844FMN2_9LACO|nr:SLAP domain-containing protein [Lactobacillus equicursoris]MST79628.1 N-acetylmuramoyl-L-alanine amidase [Lactobacillus equicursoris]
MKFKRLLVSMLAVGALTFGFAGQAQTASASINSDAKKKTYSGTKYLKDLLKAAGMTYNQFNSVANGKKYGSRFGYRKGVGKPEGVVVHETATPGATAWDEGRYFNNNWKTSYTYIHAVVDNTKTIQLMSTDYGVWGAGPIANKRYIQIELCEVSTRSQFVQSVANDAYYIATLLHSYNLTPSRANKNGSGTIWSHNEVSHYLGGTDHGDPDGYFAKWGYSMSKFYSLITYYYNKQAGSSSKSSSSSSSSKSSSSSSSISKSSSSSSSSKKPASQAAGAMKKRLMRNSYTYNSAGQKQSTKAIKAGSYLTVYGSAVTIGNSKFYRYGTNKYVKADSIDGTVKTLKHNAYVYSAAGSRIKTEATRKKGTRVTAYGSAVTIKGKKYYMIGFSGNTALYVKAGNFVAREVGMKKRLMRNTYTYNGRGQKVTSIAKFKAGSYLTVYGSAVTIGNTKFYRYGTNKYVKADSIDGTVKTLKHNAYVYSAAGSRIKTEATRKKWTRVTAYGSAVTIKGKKYYMIGFSGNTALYLKAGNF